MGTQDFPLHLPNHETTLNAKPILVFAPCVKQSVVKSATLELLHAYSQKVHDVPLKQAQTAIFGAKPNFARAIGTVDSILNPRIVRRECPKRL
jgi:hypothetical protein